MRNQSWMIYGAYGYTGALLAEEALRRGHRPILAGRSIERLAPLARRLHLDSLAVDLDDRKSLAKAVGDVGLVLHAAGPFIHTSRQMVDACLAAGTSYIDITGELSVIGETLRRDAEARERGVLLLPGGGFDVVPTDCLAAYLADRLPDAVELELAIDAITTPSGGTIASTLEMLPSGGWVRRDGRMSPYPLGKGARRQRFPRGMRRIVPLPLGDLETAYRSTGIPNITTYMAMPAGAAPVLRVLGSPLRSMMGSDRIRHMAEGMARRFMKGPGEEERRSGRSYLWGRVRNATGKEIEAWLETVEAYQFTAAAGVLAVEHVLREKPVGALPPAEALGRDFVMEIPGTRRHDALPVK